MEQKTKFSFAKIKKVYTMRNNYQELFDSVDFQLMFGSNLYVENVFLEYDEIPILCSCRDDSGNKWFCHCTEFRSHEEWVFYPTNQRAIQTVVNKQKTYEEAFARNASDVLVYVIYYESGLEKLRQLNVNDLPEYDVLPKGW